MKTILIAAGATLAMGGCATAPHQPGQAMQLVDMDGNLCPADAPRQSRPSSAYTAAVIAHGGGGCRTRSDWQAIREAARVYERCTLAAERAGGSANIWACARAFEYRLGFQEKTC